MGGSPKCFLEGQLSVQKANIFNGLVPVLCGTGMLPRLRMASSPSDVGSVAEPPTKEPASYSKNMTLEEDTVGRA